MKPDILSGLNTQQAAAVKTTEGPVRVIAGAGSGKTKALAHRYAYLVSQLGISPANILSVTFTNKAAAEMKKRIAGLIGDGGVGTVATFHGFCVQLLKEDCHLLQYPPGFIILDEEDAKSVLEKCFRQLEITSKQLTVRQAAEYIGGKKHTLPYQQLLTELEMNALQQKRHTAQKPEERVFYEYLYEQRKCFAFDFDDLILFALHILEQNEQCRDKWQKRLEYIMVDEFQDVSEPQYRLARILSGYHNNLFIVGDPDQTIYSWRGAKVEFILNFEKNFPGCRTVVMDRNYRCLPEIIAASNALIRKNRCRVDKNLVALRREKGEAAYFHAKTQRQESDWIADTIVKLREKGTPLSDIAVLYRAHYVSRNLEESLVRRKIPYTLYSGTEFYRRKEIKDALCYLRMVSHGDDISFLRIINEPRRGMGKKRIALLQAHAEKTGRSLWEALGELKEDPFLSPACGFIGMMENYRRRYREMTLTDLLTGLLQESGYEQALRSGGNEDRLDNLAEFKQSVYDYENTWGEEGTAEKWKKSGGLPTSPLPAPKTDCC